MEVDSEDKGYVCQLNEYSLKKALEELNEDPSQRLSSIKTLRAWIKSQAHFTSRDDTEFLLQVLRTAKFSQLRARQIIELILTWRTKCSEFMANIDTHEPALIKMIDQGAIVPLPNTDREGRRIMLIRMGLTDLNDPRMTVVNDARTMLSVTELLRHNNENQSVNGACLVVDMSKYHRKLLLRAASDDSKKFSRILQDCLTGRVKGVHFYNAGTFFEVFVGIIKPRLKKKLIDRIHVHNTMESLYKAIPMELWPEEYLPDDYKGPSAGPLQGIVDDLRRRLMDPEFQTLLLDVTSDRYKIDETKRIVGVTQESFRKLNLD